jgi:hypothetical protein
VDPVAEVAAVPAVPVVIRAGRVEIPEEALRAAGAVETTSPLRDPAVPAGAVAGIPEPAADLAGRTFSEDPAVPVASVAATPLSGALRP